MPQGSMLGPILLHIFINDLLWIWNSELLNFADNKTVSAAENIIEELISTLEKEIQAAIDWLVSKDMIVNPEKQKPTTISLIIYKYYTQTLSYATSLAVGPRGSSQTSGVAKRNLGLISFPHSTWSKPEIKR